MNISIINFSIKLTFTLLVAFGAHILALNYFELPLFDNKIILAYVINLILAIIIFATLHKLKDKFKEQLGFLFIAGSFLKFIVFFIVFYGTYKADGVIKKPEFAAFFVPYILCLTIETFSLAKWLNKLE